MVFGDVLGGSYQLAQGVFCGVRINCVRVYVWCITLKYTTLLYVCERVISVWCGMQQACSERVVVSVMLLVSVCSLSCVYGTAFGRHVRREGTRPCAVGEAC